MTQTKLSWQSKTVLLLVLPIVGADLVLQIHWWATQSTPVAVWSIGLSLLLGLITWKLRAATPGASIAGAAITANLTFSTVVFPYEPWRSALIPVLAVAVVAHVATRIGRRKKEQLGIAEQRIGRLASQVSANLGVAALVSCEFAQSWITDSPWFAAASLAPLPLFAPALAALAEAAADTVSSEIGQIFGGNPRMITTLRSARPGTDGAITLAGTLAGVLAGAIIAAAGTWALRGDLRMFAISTAGAVFGLFFDSLLGATVEKRGWLNNDMVNFLSTASATTFALVTLALLPHFGVGK